MKEQPPYNDDTFLARWLNKDLSEEEKVRFEASEAYQEYKKIIEAADDLSAPPYEMEKAWNQLQQAKNQERKSIRKIQPWINYAAAAAGLLLLVAAIWLLWPVRNIEYLTQYGEQETITLPDRSTVQLNARSTLTYNPKNWRRDRNVQLEGEAYFAVEEGSQFTVSTPSGKVQVLGTEFNVWNRKEQFEVHCYSGRVQVSAGARSTIITAKQKAYWINEHWTVENVDASATAPSWTKGVVTFEAAPLTRVLQELKYHYDVQITLVGNTQRNYTGGFPTNNLEAALTNITEPLNLTYQIADDNRVILRAKPQQE